jgi:hypothetical protein
MSSLAVALRGEVGEWVKGTQKIEDGNNKRPRVN